MSSEVYLLVNYWSAKDVNAAFRPKPPKMSVLNDLTDLPQIQSPLLYIFEGELVRISRTITEVRCEPVLSGYGELYGLYSHSRGPVVHLATLKKPGSGQLKQALSSRRVDTENEYCLSLLGGWFAVPNFEISSRHLIQTMADTLSENETTACIVANTVNDTYDFEDMGKSTHAFFLTKDKIFRMGIEIIRRESPFQFDRDFCESLSSHGYVVSLNCNETDYDKARSKGLLYGTEVTDMSTNSKPDAVTSNSDRSVNDVPKLKVPEFKHLHSNDMSDETKEDSAAEKSTPDSSSPKHDLIPEEYNNAESQKREKNEKVSSAPNGPNDEMWVIIESDIITKQETQNNKIDDERKDGIFNGKREKDFDGSAVSETNSTNEKTNVCEGNVKQLNENVTLKYEEINSNDGEVASETCSANVERLVSNVSPGKNEKTIMDGQQDMKYLPVENSFKDDESTGHVGKSSHENNDNGGKGNELDVKNLSTEESSQDTHL